MVFKAEEIITVCRLEPIMLKIYLLLLPKLPKIFTHYSFLIPIAPPIVFYSIVSNDNITYRSDFIFYITYQIVFTD